MARISDRKFLGKVKYKDVIYLSNASKSNANHYNAGHGCPVEPTARISVRKFLGLGNYRT